MALELKLELSIDPEVKTITIKEITGEYDTNNLSGWGNPNIDKKDVAMVLYATYQPYDQDKINISEIYSQKIYFYNPDALNNAESIFYVPYIKDGWHEFNVTVVPISIPAPVENNIYFDVTLEKLQIYKTDAFVDLETADWEFLSNSSLYTTTNLKEILLLNLIKQRNCQLEKYFECMLCSSCKCQNEKEEFVKLDSMIQATDYRFHSDKPFEAQRMVEILTKQFKCCK